MNKEIKKHLKCITAQGHVRLGIDIEITETNQIAMKVIYDLRFFNKMLSRLNLMFKDHYVMLGFMI